MGRLRNIEELFAGRHFDREVILLCVVWHLRTSSASVIWVEMMAERGLQLQVMR
jgi:transposase-like protein